MRALVLFALLAAGCEEEIEPPRAPARPAAGAASEAAKKRDECRDGCEQNVIVAGGGDAELRACRARCDGATPAAPHEAPSKITVAPPAHAPPNVQPKRR